MGSPCEPCVGRWNERGARRPGRRVHAASRRGPHPAAAQCVRTFLAWEVRFHLGSAFPSSANERWAGRGWRWRASKGTLANRHPRSKTSPWGDFCPACLCDRRRVSCRALHLPADRWKGGVHGDPGVSPRRAIRPLSTGTIERTRQDGGPAQRDASPRADTLVARDPEAPTAGTMRSRSAWECR